MAEENDVSYSHELIDFPDAQELRDLTTPKEEIFKAKKRSFIMSIGGDLVNKAKNMGEYTHSATLASNFLGLTENEQIRMLNEVTDFLTKQGLKVEIIEHKENIFNGEIIATKTIKLDWSKDNNAN